MARQCPCEPSHCADRGMLEPPPRCFVTSEFRFRKSANRLLSKNKKKTRKKNRYLNGVVVKPVYSDRKKKCGRGLTTEWDRQMWNCDCAGNFLSHFSRWSMGFRIQWRISHGNPAVIKTAVHHTKFFHCYVTPRSCRFTGIIILLCNHLAKLYIRSDRFGLDSSCYALLFTPSNESLKPVRSLSSSCYSRGEKIF